MHGYRRVNPKLKISRILMILAAASFLFPLPEEGEEKGEGGGAAMHPHPQPSPFSDDVAIPFMVRQAHHERYCTSVNSIAYPFVLSLSKGEQPIATQSLKREGNLRHGRRNLRIAGKFFTIAFFLTFMAVNRLAAESVKLATAVRQSPVYYLPVMACIEKGFCEKQGINAEWVPFGSATAMYQAVAAGSVKIGLTHIGSQLQVASRGLPVVVVSDLKSSDDFSIWVKTRSSYRSAKDLKGAKLGVSRFGGVEHAYGRIIAKAAGLEREVRFISTGGIPESLASLKTGSIDGVVLSPHQMIKLKEAGEVRELAAIGDYLPKPWMGYVIFAEQGLVKNSLATLGKTLHALLDSIRFAQSNSSWTIAKMKEEAGYSDNGARSIFESLRLTSDGLIQKEAAENARRVLLEYEIIGKDAPRAEEIYTMEALKAF